MEEREASELTTVFARSVSDSAERTKISATSADELLDMVRGASDVSSLIVEVDRAFCREDYPEAEGVIALTAVLVDAGVVAFETHFPVSVRRILDTHAAIKAGSIEAVG